MVFGCQAKGELWPSVVALIQGALIYMPLEPCQFDQHRSL